MGSTATTTTSATANSCSDCGVRLGRTSVLKSVFWILTNPNDYPCDNPECQARLCVDCHGKHPLMTTTTVGDATKNPVLQCFCKLCFERTSTVDYTKTYDTIEGTSNIVLVFVHGASGTRQMFQYHAQALKTKFGHSSILLDLPGHGTLVDTPLTLESATATVQAVLQECHNLTKDKRIVYVGASLGGYIGFYVLQEMKDVLCGAVIMDCGQNVGPGASLKARVGLVVLDYIGKKMNNAQLMKLMWGEIKKGKATEYYHLVETTVGAGMFFDQASAHVQCLRQVAPATLLPTYADRIPILYMNGSEDYRDSETKWLSLSTAAGSELKVYQGGDHFFTHDQRFVDDVLTRIHTFASKLE